MCISDTERRSGPDICGFTALELLIGLCLTICLALAVAPLWLSLQNAGASETGRTVSVLQGRVAIARLEKDLRLAGAGGCHFSVVAPILEASTKQVVFLRHSDDGKALMLVEWEIGNGSLMRRWGACPAGRPVAFAHSLYIDHKTMLEGVDPISQFSYLIHGEVRAAPISRADLRSVEAVILQMEGRDGAGKWSGGLSTTARVGR